MVPTGRPSASTSTTSSSEAPPATTWPPLLGGGVHERGPGDGDGAAAAAHVDLELGVLGGDVGQDVGQGDAVAQGGREGAAGHLADPAVAVVHGHAVARDQPVAGDQPDQQPLGPGLLAGGQGVAAAEVALA